jgi:hypothetical protein
LHGIQKRLGLGKHISQLWDDMDALPIQGVVRCIVGGGDLAYSASHQLCHLLGGLSSLCGFSFSFSFSLGFCFCYKSPVGEEGVCKVKQVSEAEVYFWLLVGVLIEEVGIEHSMVLR